MIRKLDLLVFAELNQLWGPLEVDLFALTLSNQPPVWQAHPWYPLLLEMCVAPPILLPQYPGLVHSSGGSTPPLKPAVSRVATIKQSYSEKGIPEGTQNLLVAAWRKGTSSTYLSAWGKWDSWRRKQEIYSVHAPIDALFKFLTYEYAAWKAYRMLNGYRSTTSGTHPSIIPVLIQCKLGNTY